MGQAKLKAQLGIPKPTAPRGQKGYVYYCKNGCGTVLQQRHDCNRTIFIERNEVPGWGWCAKCVDARNAAVLKAQEEQLRASHAYANDDPVIPDATRS